MSIGKPRQARILLLNNLKMKKAFYLILAGVAIGILIAPDKGSETWRKLKAGIEDLKDQAMDKVNDLVTQGKDLVSTGKDFVGETETANRSANSANEW